jgi:hypothetical protein
MKAAAAAVPTVGMVFECGPQGADKQVCEYLAQHLRPGIRVKSRTLDNKDNLLRDAGKVAAQLLKDGCACVLVVWDLRPAWPDKKDKPCRRTERQTLLARQAEAGLPADAPVYLVCIEQELESWLLANEKAIEAVLSTAAHAYSVRRARPSPDSVPQPKSELIKHFKTARGWRYDDKVDALRVLRAAPIDLPRMRRSVSFERFESKLLACSGLPQT